MLTALLLVLLALAVAGHFAWCGWSIRLDARAGAHRMTRSTRRRSRIDLRSKP